MESKDINEPRDQKDFALDGDIEPNHLKFDERSSRFDDALATESAPDIGIPTCPRAHPGMMYLDSDPITGDHEWVCRACGVRLYGGTAADAQEPPIATEKPINEKRGNLSGNPRVKQRCGCWSDQKHEHRKKIA